MEQPAAALSKGALRLAERFVAAAGQLSAAGQRDGKPELGRLGGADVEEGDRLSQKRQALAVFHRYQPQPAAQKTDLFFAQQRPRQRAQKARDFPVGIDDRFSLVLAPGHALQNHPDQPQNAGDVVQVLVGHEDGADVLPAHPGGLQLAENAVAAARVHQKVIRTLGEQKAGVVALGHGGVAGAENGQFHGSALLCFSIPP